MTENKTHIYKTVWEDTSEGSERQKLKVIWEREKINIKFQSMYDMYLKWKFRQGFTGVDKGSKAAPSVLKEVEEPNENSFLEIVNQLKPDANPLNLPKSLEEDYRAFKLPVHDNDILLISDIHIPYHNIQALTSALRYGIEHEVNTILINGDLIDFYAISRFQKDPRKRNFGNEVLMTRQFLATLRELFPTQAIYFKCGNHDVRYEHYIMEKAPDLLSIGEFNLESLLHLDKFNIQFIPDKQLIHAGKLTILHGHELGKSVFSPVNVARGLYLRAKDNALCGHSHQTSNHVEPNINGKVVACWSVGCLSELHPEYSPINKYNHGFAHIQVMDGGDFEVQNFTIINGQVR